MRVLHCISGLSKAHGGPSNSVPGLARSVRALGIDAKVWTVAEEGHIGVAQHQGPGTVAFAQSSPRILRASRDMKKQLMRGPGADIYHGHGLWHLPVHYMASVARRTRRPYLIAPRSMLEPWALRRSVYRKLVVGWLYQNRDLREADCLHAVAPKEVESLRAHGLKNPVAVVPNGINLTEFDQMDDPSAALARELPQADTRPVLLFLSRLHPKKGVVRLVQAWARIAADYPDWLLAIVGPDEGSYRNTVEMEVQGLGIAASVALAGPLYGRDRLAAYRAADAFVLPSFSEGFSNAVLEAMACSLPVLITPGCNFPEAEEAGAALVVRPRAPDLERGLRMLLGMSSQERSAMGGRGYRLVQHRYTWGAVAVRMAKVYAWLLEGGAAPPWVDETGTRS